MARLSAEQKAANREVFKARDRAFNARQKEWRTARDAALAEFDANSPEYLTMTQAMAASEEARRARDADAAELRQQIAALEERIAGLDDKHRLSELFEVRGTAVNARNKARSALQERMDNEFPDVSSVFSAVQWAANGHFTPSAPQKA
jgi:predicted  nucleic acid-binding Zn-ribbon protein